MFTSLASQSMRFITSTRTGKVSTSMNPQVTLTIKINDLFTSLYVYSRSIVSIVFGDGLSVGDGSIGWTSSFLSELGRFLSLGLKSCESVSPFLLFVSNQNLEWLHNLQEIVVAVLCLLVVTHHDLLSDIFQWSLGCGTEMADEVRKHLRVFQKLLFFGLDCTEGSCDFLNQNVIVVK